MLVKCTIFVFAFEIGGWKHMFNQCRINLPELLYNAREEREREIEENNATRERIYR